MKPWIATPLTACVWLAAACGPSKTTPSDAQQQTVEEARDQNGEGPWKVPDQPQAPPDKPQQAEPPVTALYKGAVQSASFDDAFNVWLLDGGRIGFLRAGATEPIWAEGLGQAGRGFVSSVICGGTEGMAYVGYIANDIKDPEHATEQEKSEGDVDIVRVEGNKVTLQQHLTITNSNDPNIDETRAILTCAKVIQGANAGDYYFGSNHAVTRVRGTEYSDHRHAVFSESGGSLKIGYNWALSITEEGDVFLGNEWKVAIIRPTPDLEGFTDQERSPWILDTFVEAVGAQSEMDEWRATAKTTDRRYYMGSKSKGLWQMIMSPREYTKIDGLPSDNITALAPTLMNSLYVGTANAGLWRLTPLKKVERVTTVTGTKVRQLVYESRVKPGMMLITTDTGVSVMRVD